MDTDAARLSQHLADESRYADAMLSSLLPDARALAARASSWFPAAERTIPEQVNGEFFYWTEQRAGDAGPRLLRLAVDAPPSASPTVVLDAAAVLDGLGAVGDVRDVKLSPCGRWVAVAADAGGQPAVTVRAVGAGGPELRRIRGALGMEWGRLGTGDLFYTACPADDGRPSEVRVAAGVVGRSSVLASPDPVLFTWPDARSHVALSRTKDGRWIVATAARRDAAAPHVLSLSGGGGSGGGGAPAFHRVGGGVNDDTETFVEGDGRGGLILLTNEAGAGQGGDAAPSEEAWLGWAARPATPPTAWSPLVRRRAGVVISDVDVFADSILLYERNTRVGRPRLSLAALRWDEGGRPSASLSPVRLPGAGSGCWALIRPGANADPSSPTARVVGSSPLAFPKAWDVCLRTGKVSAPAAPPETQAAADAVASAAAGLRLRRTAVPSHAPGVPPARVPLLVLEPRHAAPAASLLVLYGAYGLPLDPDLDPLWLSLALEGWAVVLAGVRGGGEGGRAWHAAGRGAKRPAALADATAAAAWAGAGGTRPVLASAHSAGGLLAAALLARGEVDGALLRAPFLDVCTHALGDGSGDPRQAALAAHEAGEWARPGDAAGLAAACPYASLKNTRPPGPLPAVLITMGDMDDRVTAAGAAKWVARWRAGGHGGGGGPALLSLRPGEGHAGPTGPDALDLVGLEAAFALAAVGKRL